MYYCITWTCMLCICSVYAPSYIHVLFAYYYCALVYIGLCSSSLMAFAQTQQSKSTHSKHNCKVCIYYTSITYTHTNTQCTQSPIPSYIPVTYIHTYIHAIYHHLLIETVQSRSELAYALKDTAQTLSAVTGERDRLVVQADKVSIP